MEKCLHVSYGDFEFGGNFVILLPFIQKDFEFFCDLSFLVQRQYRVQVLPIHHVKHHLADDFRSCVQNFGNHRAAGIDLTRLHDDCKFAERFRKTRCDGRTVKFKNRHVPRRARKCAAQFNAFRGLKRYEASRFAGRGRRGLLGGMTHVTVRTVAIAILDDTHCVRMMNHFSRQTKRLLLELKPVKKVL